jgi:hypothetical protein
LSCPILWVILRFENSNWFHSLNSALRVLLLCFVWQSDRFQKVSEFVSTVHNLCAVLGNGMDVMEVHSDLNDYIEMGNPQLIDYLIIIFIYRALLLGCFFHNGTC